MIVSNLCLLQRCLSSLRIIKPRKHKLNILKDISGIIKPGRWIKRLFLDYRYVICMITSTNVFCYFWRMTLLLGPPGSGKSTLLLALAGKLDKSLKVSWSVKLLTMFIYITCNLCLLSHFVLKVTYSHACVLFVFCIYDRKRVTLPIMERILTSFMLKELQHI